MPGLGGPSVQGLIEDRLAEGIVLDVGTSAVAV